MRKINCFGWTPYRLLIYERRDGYSIIWLLFLTSEHYVRFSIHLRHPLKLCVPKLFASEDSNILQKCYWIKTNGKKVREKGRKLVSQRFLRKDLENPPSMKVMEEGETKRGAQPYEGSSLYLPHPSLQVRNENHIMLMKRVLSVNILSMLLTHIDFSTCIFRLRLFFRNKYSSSLIKNSIHLVTLALY